MPRPPRWTASASAAARSWAPGIEEAGAHARRRRDAPRDGAALGRLRQQGLRRVEPRQAVRARRRRGTARRTCRSTAARWVRHPIRPCSPSSPTTPTAGTTSCRRSTTSSRSTTTSAARSPATASSSTSRRSRRCRRCRAGSTDAPSRCCSRSRGTTRRFATCRASPRARARSRCGCARPVAGGCRGRRRSSCATSATATSASRSRTPSRACGPSRSRPTRRQHTPYTVGGFVRSPLKLRLDVPTLVRIGRCRSTSPRRSAIAKAAIDGVKVRDDVSRRRVAVERDLIDKYMSEARPHQAAAGLPRRRQARQGARAPRAARAAARQAVRRHG